MQYELKEIKMDKYTMILKNGILIIQEADYIEDGWYIEVSGKGITLYEIPRYGGQEQKIDDYETILEAIEAGNALT